jgi:hypothetical protein
MQQERLTLQQTGLLCRLSRQPTVPQRQQQQHSSSRSHRQLQQV